MKMEQTKILQIYELKNKNNDSFLKMYFSLNYKLR